MYTLTNLITDLRIASLENRIDFAAVSMVDNCGKIQFQTENFVFVGNTQFIIDVLVGKEHFILNG